MAHFKHLNDMPSEYKQISNWIVQAMLTLTNQIGFHMKYERKTIDNRYGQ